MVFCHKSSRFTNSENTVDRGSAVNFGADSGLCLSIFDVWILGPEQKLDHRSSFSLCRYVNEFIQIIFFSNESHLNLGMRLLLELCYIVIKHVA